MRADFEIEGKRYEVEISDGSESPCQVIVNGRMFDLEFISSLEERRIVIIRNGKPYEILLKENGRENMEFHVGGGVLSVNLVDDKDIRKLASAKDSFGGKVVSSIMPGKVVRVFAKVGMNVGRGDPLLVVEAMKMENELKAPADGTVRQVNAEEGKSIEANAPLVIIE